MAAPLHSAGVAAGFVSTDTAEPSPQAPPRGPALPLVLSPCPGPPLLGPRLSVVSRPPWVFPLSFRAAVQCLYSPQWLLNKTVSLSLSLFPTRANHQCMKPLTWPGLGLGCFLGFALERLQGPDRRVF